MFMRPRLLGQQEYRLKNAGELQGRTCGQNERSANLRPPRPSGTSASSRHRTGSSGSTGPTRRAPRLPGFSCFPSAPVRVSPKLPVGYHPIATHSVPAYGAGCEKEKALFKQKRNTHGRQTKYETDHSNHHHCLRRVAHGVHGAGPGIIQPQDGRDRNHPGTLRPQDAR